MEVAALVTWLVTAVGGFVLLGTWLARGGARSPAGTSAAAGVARDAAGSAGLPVTAPTRLPPPLVFGHVLLAVAGLVVWIVYLVNDSEALAWTAFVLLVPVALLGLTMFARWLQAGDHRRTAPVDAGAARPESHFPLPIVIGHGLFAVTTVVLVLLTALGVGES
jgi:manganese efflux pump family protein